MAKHIKNTFIAELDYKIVILLVCKRLNDAYVRSRRYHISLLTISFHFLLIQSLDFKTYNQVNSF